MSYRMLTYGLVLMSVLLLGSPASSEPVPVPLHINHRQFADELTDRLYENENECSSALGVSMAFSLVYPSTTGNATTQIRTVLGYPEGSQLLLVWNETSSILDESYEGTCLNSAAGGCFNREPALEIANSIWIDDDNALDSEYNDVVGSYLRQIDFDHPTAGGLVNEWVNASTRGLIDSIVPYDALSPAILLAVNSIYLKANWPQPFRETNTNQDVFYTAFAARVSTTAYFMHKVDYFPYSHDALPGFQVLQMDFNAGNLAMLLVLPANGDTGTADSVDVLSILPQLNRTRIALALPKFKFESTYSDNLKDALISMGIVAPFSSGLCIFENDCTASISSIIQKTFLSVDEEGVEAAAVTAIPVGSSAKPVDETQPTLFQADHPFQFHIYDQTTQLVIFEGRVGNPGIPEGAPIPTWQADHADADFWSSRFNVQSPIVPDLIQAIPHSSPLGNLISFSLRKSTP